jgi:CubicO group peptidase (beta-lactamase class C family)
MKKLVRVLAGIAAALLVLVGLMYLTNTDYLLRGIRATYLRGETSATIDDMKFFHTAKVAAGKPVSWPIQPKSVNRSARLDSTLMANQSVAFLVVQSDTIIHETYWNHNQDTPTNSFSMAKTVTVLLTQIAIQNGVIKSWQEPVMQWIPELKGPFAKDLTLAHLATMTAGSDWKESYSSPFSITARSYYASDLHQTVLEGVSITQKPGTYEYQSGATQLLAIALERATGKDLATLNSEYLWTKIGASQDAYYHTDHKGQPIAYCCFNSNARDFARLGQLLLRHGRCSDAQLLDSAFVAMAATGQGHEKYGYGLWIHQDLPQKNFYYRGILGQYIIVLPEYDAVIVRLGHKAGQRDAFDHPSEVRVFVEEVINDFL